MIFIRLKELSRSRCHIFTDIFRNVFDLSAGRGCKFKIPQLNHMTQLFVLHGVWSFLLSAFKMLLPVHGLALLEDPWLPFGDIHIHVPEFLSSWIWYLTCATEVKWAQKEVCRNGWLMSSIWPGNTSWTGNPSVNFCVGLSSFEALRHSEGKN